MVQFDNQYRQIKVKIVYYGPAQGGKTTCLQQIHRVIDPQRRTKLYSLNTASDRTLFFDLLSLNLGRIRGYRLAIQLYTVPGQVQYNATRRAVLSGADGVVFVADSQVSERDANLASLENLRENLDANGLVLDEVPLVLQYNKRDLEPLIPVDELDRKLNRDSRPSFTTVAITGDGVMDAFAAITERTLARVADRLGVGSSEHALRRLEEQVRQALRPFVADSSGAASDVRVTAPSPDVEPGEALADPQLVAEAVRANLAMTDLNAQLDVVRRDLERMVAAMSGVTEFGRVVSRHRDPKEVVSSLLTWAVKLLAADAVAVLLVPRSGTLREELTHGIEHDPLLRFQDGTGVPLANALVEARRPRLLLPALSGDERTLEDAAIGKAGFSSALAVPMLAQERIVGLLTVYIGSARGPFEDDDLELATVLAATAALAHDNAEAWDRLEGVNRDLESEVASRTEELRRSLADARQLAEQLTEKNQLLEEAQRRLADTDRLKSEVIHRVSNALRTPVNAVLTASRLLADGTLDGDDRGRRFVEIIRDESEKLAELIQSVLQASALADFSDDMEPEEVPTEMLLRHAVAPLRDLAAERGVGLAIRVPSGLKSVLCRPGATETALRALVKNAIEFSDGGQTVTLEVRRRSRQDGSWVSIQVIDRGVGVPEEELGRIFDSLWQGRHAARLNPRGIGLGLTIAKRIVEAQGGEITLQSTPDSGTEVTVSLPQ